MSFKDILLKINNENLREKLFNIANISGDKDNPMINTPTEYNQLCSLLNGEKYEKEDIDILLGLKISYENSNSGNAKGTRAGVVNGDGNAVTGDKSIGGSADGDGTVYNWGNNANITVNNYNYGSGEANDKKVDISSENSTDGKTFAKILFDETVDSIIASNDDIVDVISKVDENNAYSFFKEYKRLKNDNPEWMQDIYGVQDDWLRDVITLKQAVHLMKALLAQASNLGLSKMDSYINLQKHLSTINEPHKNPDNNAPISFDYAIEELLQDMNKIIKN